MIKDKNEEIVEPYVGSDGRMKVLLTNNNGVTTEEDVARLVAITFTDICGEPKPGLPLFKDGDPGNCAADNLYWA